MAKKTTDKPKPTKKGDEVIVELKGESKYGNSDGKAGDPIATVILEEGVSINYLVDALRNGLAQERNDEDDARRAAEEEENERRAEARRTGVHERVEVPRSPSTQPHGGRHPAK
jgi:hypothetical protein